MNEHLERLQAELGSTDVYLIDQLLRGRIASDARVFDGGAGGGRNLRWFLGAGFQTFACDSNPEAVLALRELGVPDVRAEALESNTFGRASADLVIVNAVFHFARDPKHFRAMLDGAWRVLAPGGLLFTRLTSSIGLSGHQRLGNERYRLPDGSERFLVDEGTLLDATERLGGQLADPIKTTNVQGLRCMTTWVLWKTPR